MSVSMKFKGGRELEKALAQLPAGTAKGVARRVLKKELQPVAALANSFWPGSSDNVFRVTSRISGSQMGDSHMKRVADELSLEYPARDVAFSEDRSFFGKIQLLQVLYKVQIAVPVRLCKAFKFPSHEYGDVRPVFG